MSFHENYDVIYKVAAEAAADAVDHGIEEFLATVVSHVGTDFYWDGNGPGGESVGPFLYDYYNSPPPHSDHYWSFRVSVLPGQYLQVTSLEETTYSPGDSIRRDILVVLDDPDSEIPVSELDNCYDYSSTHVMSYDDLEYFCIPAKI